MTIKCSCRRQSARTAHGRAHSPRRGLRGGLGCGRRDALAQLEAMEPDVLQCWRTCLLPGTSGYELCRWIKTSDRHKHAGVILIAGLLEPVDEEEAQRQAAMGFEKALRPPRSSMPSVPWSIEPTCPRTLCGFAARAEYRRAPCRVIRCAGGLPRPSIRPLIPKRWARLQSLSTRSLRAGQKR